MPPRQQWPYRTAGTATQAFAITPDDDNDLAQYPQGIWVGSLGDVVAVFEPGSDPITFGAVPAGTHLPISPSRIMEATTADDLVGLV